MNDEKPHGPTLRLLIEAFREGRRNETAEYRMKFGEPWWPDESPVAAALEAYLSPRAKAEEELVPCPLCGNQPVWIAQSGDNGYYRCGHDSRKPKPGPAYTDEPVGPEPEGRRSWNDAFGLRVAPQPDRSAAGVSVITISPAAMDLASEMARCATDLRLALLSNRELDSGPTEQYAQWCEQQARDLFACLLVDRKAS